MIAPTTRLLRAGDVATVNAFLRRHLETSVFLLGNSAAAGLDYEGKRLQGVYVGAFAGDQLVAIACHAWQGNLLLQAPEHTGLVTRACVRESGRAVQGIIGPWAQVEAARGALGLDGAETTMSNPEVLYCLDLDDLAVPEPVASGALSVRRARANERALLAGWRADYMVEALGYPDSDATRAAADAEWAEALEGDSPRDLFVLVEDGRVVAMSSFNARLLELVQIGGVWTPVADRRRGLGRAVVAGQLLIARAEGVPRSILFTDHDNVGARRAYEALGYREVGDYGIVLFARPIDLQTPVNVTGIDHLYVAVSDLPRAEAFYDPIMELLGFKKGTRPIAGEPHVHYFNRVTQYTIRPAHADGAADAYRPGALHHLCWRVADATAVNAAFRRLCLLGVEATAPRHYPEYRADYYATFFEDPDGTRLEIVCDTELRRTTRERWDELDGFVDPIARLVSRGGASDPRGSSR